MFNNTLQDGLRRRYTSDMGNASGPGSGNFGGREDAGGGAGGMSQLDQSSGRNTVEGHFAGEEMGGYKLHNGADMNATESADNVHLRDPGSDMIGAKLPLNTNQYGYDQAGQAAVHAAPVPAKPLLRGYAMQKFLDMMNTGV